MSSPVAYPLLIVLDKILKYSCTVHRPLLSKGSINPAERPIAITFFTQTLLYLPVLNFTSLNLRESISLSGA